MSGVDVFAERLCVVARFVTNSTRVVVQREVLSQCDNCLEFLIAVRASLTHCIINSEVV